MFNVYSFKIADEDGNGLALVAASTPEEAIELLGWKNWEHPDNCDRTVKVLDGVKSDRKGLLEQFYAYNW